MSSEPSQFIVPQYELQESFESGSGSAAQAEPTTVSAAISASDADVADLQAALAAVEATKPVGAKAVDSVFGFFAGVIDLIKYIGRTLLDGFGLTEIQFGYIVLGLGALFMTLPLWGEPRFVQNPLPRNSRNPTVYTPVGNINGTSPSPSPNKKSLLQSQVE